MPWRWRRWESSSPAGPAPMMPTCVRVSLILHSLQHLARDPEGGICRRDATVDRALQQDLFDLGPCQAVAEGGAEMERQLLMMPERDEGGECDGAAHAPVEPRPRPDFPPGIAGNEILKLPGELGAARKGSLDVVIPQNLTAHGHAALILILSHRISSLPRPSDAWLSPP